VFVLLAIIDFVRSSIFARAEKAPVERIPKEITFQNNINTLFPK